jgi:hypothetical protein
LRCEAAAQTSQELAVEDAEPPSQLPPLPATADGALIDPTAALVASITAAINAAVTVGNQPLAALLSAQLAQVLVQPLPDGVATLDAARRRRRG